jgi:predicted MFS family arabinose efflux permease
MWRWLIAPIAICFAVAAFWIVLALPPGPQFSAETKECDRQVAVLRSTHDPVELRRAMFLVRWLNCSVGKRL